MELVNEFNIPLRERLATVETRLDSHDKQIISIEREIELALNKSSESRRHMHDKIEAVDKRINGLLIGGLAGLIMVLLNVIISIILIYINVKSGG